MRGGDDAFLETAATNHQPVAPTTLPQIGSLLKALVEVLSHANEAVGHRLLRFGLAVVDQLVLALERRLRIVRHRLHHAFEE